MLGLYDSGLGGLTVLSALRAAGIDQDVIYFADQAHVPYGDRTDAELAALLAENFALLASHGVDAIVMACNTSCAVASRKGWPPSRVPVLDLIENAGKAFENTGFATIAVFATKATVRSGAYGHAIRAAAPDVDVIEISAPALVPLVESGAAGTPESLEAVRMVCEEALDVDAIVYGCTHYPLLDKEFADALGTKIVRIDPARAQAIATRDLIAELALPRGKSETRYLTNGDLAAFEANIRKWTGDATGLVSSATALVR
jgi:glutamate racemase